MKKKSIYIHPELSVKLFATNDVITESDNLIEWPWGDEEEEEE